MFRRLLSNYSSTRNGQRAAFFLIVTVLLSLGISSQIGIVRAADIFVTDNDDTSDNGICDATCTLPEAILAAGASDEIHFNVSGGTIFLSGALPAIAVPITIDGTTQGGATCDAPSLTIDGSAAPGDGLVLTAGATGSTIQGLAITGFPGDGILVSGASNTDIECNKLTLNGGNGVNVAAGTGNTIRENSIANNGGLGIALNGGNNGQVAPVLILAQSDGVTGTLINGTLNSPSTPSESFGIDWFTCDSDPDEGETWLIASPLATDPAGFATINLTLPTPLNVGDMVSATVTNLTTGDTSPFSACEPVIGKPIYQSNPVDGSPITINTSVGSVLGDNIANIQVINPGNAQLDITAINLTGAGFTLLTPQPPPTISVAALDVITGTTISVECDVSTATGGTPYTGTLTVSHNGPGPTATYNLECNVAALPVPDYDSVPPPGSTINFFDVTVGFTSTFNLRVDSAGSAPLDITSDSITGPEAAEFSIVSGQPPFSVGGGGFVNVILECAPTALGARNADLTFTTNDPDVAEATVTYPMTCNGVPPVITLIPPGPTLPPTFEGDLTYSEIFDATGGTTPYTFALTSGALPLGMNFTGGVLDGEPAAGEAGTYNFTITATDDLGFDSAAFLYSLVVHPPIVVAPPALPAGTEGVAYPSTFITATGGSGSYVSFVVSPPGDPPGLTLNFLTGEITGTPTDSSGSPYAIDVTVTDSLGATGVQSYSVVINPSPLILQPLALTLPNATQSTPYTFNFTAIGGTATYTFASPGPLPGGLGLAADGTLSGTPTAAGTFTFDVTVTDSTTPTALTDTKTYTLTVDPFTPVVLQPLVLTLPNAAQGTAYTFNFTATGGTPTYTFASPGPLPGGLGLAADGTLSGTPTAAGTFTFDVTVTDSTTPTALTDTKTYTLTVDPLPPVVLQPLVLTLPNAAQGTAYTFNFTATGGTPGYTFASPGPLPGGLGIAADGTLSGIPTAAGTFTFDVTVTDSTTPTALTDTKTYTLTVDPIPPVVLQPLALTLPNAAQGTAYTFNFTATGGTPTYTFASPGPLPGGLGLAADGTLSGIPTAAGTFTFDVTVTDSTTPTALTDTKTYTLTVDPIPPVVLQPLGLILTNGMVGTPYTFNFTATGGTPTYTFASPGPLPGGLGLAADGTLSGIPTAAGTFTFDVTVTDSTTPTALTDTKTYTLTVDPIPPVVLQPLGLILTNGMVGTPYTFNFTATGGTPGYTFASPGLLPGGLGLAANGTLSGTPTAAGTFTFDVTVTDSTTPTALTDTKTYTLTIDPPPPLQLQPAAGAIASGTENVAYTFNFSAIGGTAGYTFTTPGPLPTGLGLAANGTLSGTPALASAGTYTFSVTVTDSTTPTALTDTKTYTLTINPPGTITLGPLSISNGAINVPFNASFSVSPTANYSFTLTGGTLPPGLTLSPTGTASGTISGTPSPTSTGTYNFTIQADNGAGGTQTRPYTIIISQPIYASTPVVGTTLNLGTVQIGTAISLDLTIRNDALAPATLTVSRVGTLITGTNAADFSLPNLPPNFNGFSIAGKANAGSQPNAQVVTIRCIPSAAGLRVATLTFGTNDPTKPSVQYPLACTGSGTFVPTATPIGFVATATAFVVPPTAVLPATGTVEEVKGLAMRTGPYLGATLVGKLVPGISYSILARSNDEGGGITWYLVTTEEGVTGWVSGLYLVVTGNIDAVPFQGSIFDQIDGAPDTGITARAMSIIDIRRRPSGRAAIIGQVPQDGNLMLLGRTRQNGGDFWVQVNYNGVIGWIPAAPISVRGFTSNVPIR